MVQISIISPVLFLNYSLNSKEWTIETFAPVANMDYIRLVLAIVASKHWEVHHMDVKSAFIHGDINEDIYMKNTKCFIHDPSLYCMLNKYLYGLKQAPMAWYG